MRNNSDSGRFQAKLLSSGWFDPYLQNKAYVDFATDAPGYGQLQSDDVIAALNKAFYEEGGCGDQELACYNASNADAAGLNGPGNSTLSDEVCSNADNFCVSFCSSLLSSIFGSGNLSSR